MDFLITADRRFGCLKYIWFSQVIDQAWGEDIWVIDQKRKVKMTGYWPSWTRSVKNGFIFSYCFMENCSCGTQWVLPNEKDSAILTARIANHSAVFGTYLYSNCYPALISVNLQCLCSVVYFHNVILQTCFVESRNLSRNWKKNPLYDNRFPNVIDPLHKWCLNLNNNTWYILSLTFM